MTTPKDLFLEERRQEILSRIKGAGRASVADLSQQLGVSEVTIRTDLQALAEQKLVIRTHGGAIPAGSGRYDLALARRRQHQVQEKSRIGEACAAMVSNGDAIFIDSSSTALAMTPHLIGHRYLTVVTNSLSVAQALREAEGVRVVITGGTLRRETDSLLGVAGLEAVRQFNLQKGFFGAHGLNLPEGLTDVSAEEAEVKRVMVELCRQTIGVLDATKWGQVGVASFARPDDIDIIITDRTAPTELVERVSGAGVEVVLV
ncbi:MAG: DeoR/GlpR family DNA-binding transcription regulator [Anaerolineae bacterium]|nr:DeoR/GlpR family DNA-binding transcription regulator [Anaerolineae bacterium]